MFLAVSISYGGLKAEQMSTMEMEHIERALSMDLSLLGLPPPSPWSSYFLENDNRVECTWKPDAATLSSIMRIFSWDMGFHLKTTSEIESVKERCSIVHFSVKKINGQDPATSPPPLKCEPVGVEGPSESTAVMQLVQEYRANREALANAAVRGRRIEQEIANLGGKELGLVSELELIEGVHDLEEQVKEEQVKLFEAEKVLEDVLRECEQPVVVPELVRLMSIWDPADAGCEKA